jgi:hypothetical protein
MNSVNLQIAGFIIRVNFIKIIDESSRFNMEKYFKKAYRGFIYPTIPSRIDFTINLSDKIPTLLLKRNTSNFLFFYKSNSNKSVTANSHMGWIHFSLLFKDILSRLLKSKGFILHASASKIGQNHIVFLGENGAGKSTITQLLKPKGKVLADDSIIIKEENGRYYLYQTPFVEKNRVKRTSKKYLLTSLMFLKKSSLCRLLPLERSSITKLFLKQLYSDNASYLTDIKVAFRFLTKFDHFYELQFTKDDKVLELLKPRTFL